MQTKKKRKKWIVDKGESENDLFSFPIQWILPYIVSRELLSLYKRITIGRRICTRKRAAGLTFLPHSRQEIILRNSS